MLIDWFTVGAQIVNFLILVLLLRRFLYGPIVRAMQAREANIAARLEEARRAAGEAAQEAARYREQSEALEAAREDMLRAAQQEAEAWRKELLEKARHDADRARAVWQKAIAQERQAFLEDLRQRIGQQSFAVARRTLADLAGADVERQAVQTFIQRLDQLDEASRATLLEAADGAQAGLSVATAFDLPSEARRNLQAALRERLGAAREVRFETDPSLIAGLELRAPGYKVAWSVADYLDALEISMAEALHQPEETG